MANELKAQGNAAFAAKDFEKAIDFFTQAIELDPTNHVLYSNRSGSYASLKNFDRALEDAAKTTELKPDWSKGFSRKGAALHGTGDLIGAVDAYEDALKLDPNNAQAKSGLNSVKEAINREAPPGGAGDDIGSMFADPNLIARLQANPKTSEMMKDPAVVEKVRRVQANPKDMSSLLGDPAMMQVLAVILGIDIQMPPGGMGGMGGAGGASGSGDSPMPDAPQRARTPPPPAKEATPEPEDEEARQKLEAKAKAEEEKKLGNEKYKKREFEAAVEHYDKAWELHKDITYLNNKAAAKFEAGDYEGCIKECETAIEEGRSMLADFKLIAKAFGRIGTAYQKLNDLGKAIEYYQRSLTEHRTPDILTKLRTAEKAKIVYDRDSYIDPEKAEAAREEGNAKFKEADWPGAVAAYTEMVKRAPSDPRGYSNRAAALAKLLSFPDAVRDCDAALKLDPKFMRAHIRRAQAYFGMKEYNKAVDALNDGTAADTEGKHTREIEEVMQKIMSTMYDAHSGETEEETMARIQKDPEILQILQDPVMQTILQQAKGNPAALQEHMRNPQVRSRIQKLLMSGVIRMGR